MRRAARRTDTTVATKPRRDVILDVAASLFREHGFAGTGLRDIAAGAGMLLGSVHYRFPSKEALLVALMERAIDRVMASVRAAAESVEDPLERLRLGLTAHLDSLLSGDDAVYVLLYDWRVLRGAARDKLILLRDRYEAFWNGMLYAAAGSGRLRAGVDLELLRLLGFGAINWVATWYDPRGRHTPRQIADAFFDTMLRGVLSEEARNAPSGPSKRRGPKARNRKLSSSEPGVARKRGTR